MVAGKLLRHVQGGGSIVLTGPKLDICGIIDQVNIFVGRVVYVSGLPASHCLGVLGMAMIDFWMHCDCKPLTLLIYAFSAGTQK